MCAAHAHSPISRTMKILNAIIKALPMAVDERARAECSEVRTRASAVRALSLAGHIFPVHLLHLLLFRAQNVCSFFPFCSVLVFFLLFAAPLADADTCAKIMQ